MDTKCKSMQDAWRDLTGCKSLGKRWRQTVTFTGPLNACATVTALKRPDLSIFRPYSELWANVYLGIRLLTCMWNAGEFRMLGDYLKRWQNTKWPLGIFCSKGKYGTRQQAMEISKQMQSKGVHYAWQVLQIPPHQIFTSIFSCERNSHP
jgi:hypothetical protein